MIERKIPEKVEKIDDIVRRDGEIKMFRLHIDIPLDFDEAKSAEISREIAEKLKGFLSADVKKIQYRLANDEDRNVKNYLIKDENNHIANRKSVIE